MLQCLTKLTKILLIIVRIAYGRNKLVRVKLLSYTIISIYFNLNLIFLDLSQ